MFTRFLFGSLAGLCLLSMSAQSNNFSEIDQLFSEWDDLTQPGCAVGVFKDGEILYQKGYGAANLEHRVPITPTSVFRIGSVTKQFTAACFMMLVEEGKVSLDASLTDFFPDFPAYASEISMRNLLYHTSGLRDYDQLIQYCPACDFDCFYEEEMLDLIKRQKALNAALGTEFIYNNTGYWLLGVIVEKLSGMSLADFAHKHLLAPLGMRQTLYGDDYTRVIPQRAKGYEEDDESDIGYWWYNTTTSLVGDGGLYTSIHDFKHWDDAYYERDVLSDSFWKRSLAQGHLTNGERLSYAAGIECLEYRNKPIHKHTGTGFGYSAIFIRVPDAHLSVVILSNRGSAYSIEQKAETILDLFLEDDNEKEAQVEHRPQVLKPPVSLLKQYCDYYWNKSKYLAREIYLKGDTLFYGPSKNQGYPVWAIAPDRFRADNGLEIRFTSQEEGDFGLQTYRDNQILSTYHPYEPVEENAIDPGSYAGNYYSDEIMAKYVLRQEEEGLVWYNEGEKISKLIPIMTDVFRSGGGANFKFLRDENGQVSSFELGNQRLRGISFMRN